MKHVIKTGLDFQNTKYAFDEAFKVYKQQFAEYNPQFAWKSDDLAKFAFRVKGFNIEGLVLIDGGDIVIDMTVPLIARAFQGKAIEMIEKEVRVWVDRVKRTTSSESNNS